MIFYVCGILCHLAGVMAAVVNNSTERRLGKLWEGHWKERGAWEMGIVGTLWGAGWIDFGRGCGGGGMVGLGLFLT